jgi:hypothetical protein
MLPRDSQVVKRPGILNRDRVMRSSVKLRSILGIPL